MISNHLDLSKASNEDLLGELLSRTFESNAPYRAKYGDGMKVFTVGIGSNDVATVAMHCSSIDILRKIKG